MAKEENTNIKAIKEIISRKITNDKELMRAKRDVAKKYGIKIFSNAEIIRELSQFPKLNTANIKQILRKRAVRTLSGIAPVAVLTKPYECPGNCAYCPTEKDVPQSYLSNEPAVMRAIRCNYNPYIQVQDRLRALVANGHEPTKIELIVIGGTWSYFPEKYKYWYIANCFKAANDFKESFKSSKSNKDKQISKNIKQDELEKILGKEQKRNEKAKYKMIGLTLETRPDYINGEELIEMRKLGCTRVEIGVQAIDDKILKLNKRGSSVKDIADATKMLKDFGFKVTYHLMPGLPGSTAKKDLQMFEELFSDERFQPDQIKFYPCVVTKGSLLYKWWKSGKYKPYSDKVLQDLIIKCKSVVPYYVRIIRLIRDIPGESIIAGNIITNLRQVMKDHGVACNCIRCREVKDRISKEQGDAKLFIEEYRASGGKEYFISFESSDRKILYGFVRLRIGEKAYIRELHVYGALASVGNKEKKVQHSGFGKKLMQEAERIVKKNNFNELAVISGVGVRGYYRKLGFRLKDTYMVKKFK